MRDHVRALAAICRSGVSCYPNAGLPDEDGHYHETPASFAAKLADFADRGWLNIVGGCCGTTPAHIRALAEAMSTRAPRIDFGGHAHAVSGLEAVFLESDNRPVLVGERTNVIGSRKFRRLIADGDFEAAAEVARKQVKAGAQVIDVCLADPDRDELRDMAEFLPYVVRKVKVPLMIDSTDARVVELALKHSQGKAIINSDQSGGRREAARAVRRPRRTLRGGAGGGHHRRTGMAVDARRKLEVAKRIGRTAGRQAWASRGRTSSSIRLTFPVGTGDDKYIGSALETVEGIRLIKAELPDCPTDSRASAMCRSACRRPGGKC